jgi:hypothetical protein
MTKSAGEVVHLRLKRATGETYTVALIAAPAVTAPAQHPRHIPHMRN